MIEFLSPQYVKERMLCHAIIGRQGGKELIMRVDVSADFISPLLEFSTKSVYFRFDKVRSRGDKASPTETKQIVEKWFFYKNLTLLLLCLMYFRIQRTR